MEGYRAYRADRIGRRGGGAMILVREGITTEEVVRTTSPGAEVAVVNIELDGEQTLFAAIYKPPSKEISAEPLEDLLSADRIIVGGDLNAKHLTWGCNSTNKRGTEVWKCCEDKRAKVSAPEDSTTCPSSRKQNPDILDIFISKGVRIGRPETKMELSSDHYPVLCTVGGSATTKMYPSRRIVNWERFTYTCTAFRPLGSGDIEEDLAHFERYIKDTLEEATMDIQSSRENRLGLAAWERQLVRRKNAVKNRWRRTRNPEDRTELYALQREVDTMLRERREQRWTKFLEGGEADPKKTLWEILRRCRYRKDPNCPMTRKDGTLAFKDEEKAEIMADLYEEQTENHLRLPRTSDRKRSRTSEAIQFTKEELTEGIKKINPGKAAGPDDIPGKALKMLPPRMTAELLRIMNRILQEKQYPAHWKKALVVMIPKNGRDPRRPENRRPISLISALPKLFESLLMETLRMEVEGKNLINPEQFGFQRGVGAVHQAAHLAAKIKEAIKSKRKLKVVVAFLDVEKAYDKAWREHILRRMEEEDVNRELVLMIESMIYGRTFCCRSGGTRSTVREMKDGLPQGGPLSPTLFNILVGDLAKEVDKKMGFILQYADDTAIVTISNTWQSAVLRMEKALRSVGRYFEERRIGINVGKTCIMGFGAKKPRAITVGFGGKYLRVRNAGCYLGVDFNSDLRWRPHIKRRAGLATRTTKSLYRVFRGEGLTLRTKVNILKAVVLPQATYGEEIWAGATDEDTTRIRGVMSRGMRIATGAPKYVRTEQLRMDLGLQETKEKALAARRRMKENLALDASLYRRTVAGLL